MTTLMRSEPHPLLLRTLNFNNAAIDDYHAFNPTIFESSAGTVTLFRGVGQDDIRCVYRCLLDSSYNVISEPIDWSGEIQRRADHLKWVADPRAFSYQGRQFVTFNTGHSERPNSIYIVEVDAAGIPVADPIVVKLARNRRLIEKNWGFFEHEDTLYAIYTLAPLTILQCRFEPDHLMCWPIFRHPWINDHLLISSGPLHGGTSPVRVGNHLVTVFQSRAQGQTGFKYTGNLIAMESTPPFRPLMVGATPLFRLTANELQMQPQRKLNTRVEQCFYPAGLLAGQDGNTLDITYGINDFKCGYRRYAIADLYRQMQPISKLPTTPNYLAAKADNRGYAVPTEKLLRSFYWKPPHSVTGSVEDLAAARFSIGNVGDSLQIHVNAALFGSRSTLVEQSGRRLLGAGSIAHRALPGDLIWGSGFKEVPLSLTVEEKATIDVRAVRGPLTADYLARNGVDISHIGCFFDPGLLVGEIFATQIAECRKRVQQRKGLLLIPHYKDTPAIQHKFKGRGYRIRSVDCDLFEMISEILSAEIVIASSLHGVILAEAVGVPAVLMRPPESEPFTKYHDYYAGTARDSFPIIDDPEEVLRMTVPDLPVIPANWRQTVPGFNEINRGGLFEPVYSLDNDLVFSSNLSLLPGQRINIDIAKYAGDRFSLHIDASGRAPIQVILMDDSGVLHDRIYSPSDTVALAVDGEAIETRGGLLHLTIHEADNTQSIVPERIWAQFPAP